MARQVVQRRWLYAVVAPAMIVAAILAFRPLLDKVPFTSLLAAVIFVAWKSGEAPAILATTLSMLFAMFFYLAPHGSLHVQDPADVVGLAVFFTVAVFAGRATANLRATLRREHAARTEADEQRVEAEQLRERAEATSRAKDEFLAMLGHELRNPLEAIAASAGVLKRTREGDERAALARDVIARQVAHLRTLTSELLDVARLTTGKIVLSRQPIDLADVTQTWWKTLGSTGALRRHRAHLHAEAAWVDGDRTRLVQIVENLVANAIKYTPAEGEITVTTGVEQGEAVLRVSDTGIGIDLDLLPRVFDPFVQGAQTSQRATGGLGIGLTLVKRLAEMHGGRVTVSSAGPGHGSTFAVRLPAIQAPASAPAVPMAAVRASGKRVLIVEDDPDCRDMLRALLELDGFDVHVTDDGVAALERAQALRPDVVLLDIGLPGIDGYEVARRLRAAAAAHVPRLIALSGYGQPEDRRRSQVAGFDAHLVKPVDETVLAEALWSTGVTGR